MKKIVCSVVALLLTLPAWAKLNAHEEARINAMLNALAQKKDLTFVRNGDAHNCEEAVSHLRLKLGNTRNRIDTAEQFIDKVASSSSITGKPYIVKILVKRMKMHSLIYMRLLRKRIRMLSKKNHNAKRATVVF